MIDSAKLVLPVDWVRAELYCQATGEPMEAVYERIRDGAWAAQKHYKRTGQRTLWINLKEAQEWIRRQPHVETVIKISRKASNLRTAPLNSTA